MVKVTPHHYVLQGGSLMLPGMDYGHVLGGQVLELYFVGNADAGYRAWPGSWILDDRHQPLPGRGLAGDGFHGTDVRGGPDEVVRWTRAQQAAEAALRDAEEQLLRDHGLTEARIAAGVRQLRRTPGWRALARRWRPLRSRRAFAQYRKRARGIQEAYLPVRDEIRERVWEAERQAREQWERIRAVAARVWWSYRIDQARHAVHVFHEDGAVLDTWELAEKLLEVRRRTGVAELRWSGDARAEVARSSGVDFETWWCAVVPRPWTDSRTVPQNRVDRSGRAVHVSAHTSFGIGFSSPGPHT
jgi:hypothetical protein